MISTTKKYFMVQRTIRKILHLTIGLTFLCIGILGLILPILNGVLFLILGFIVISFESTYVENKLVQITQKNKTVHYWYIKLEKIMRKLFRM